MYDLYQNSFLTLTISIFDSVVLYGTRFLLFLTERIMCTSFVFTGDVEYCIILSKALLFDSIILFLNLFYYEVDWLFMVFIEQFYSELFLYGTRFLLFLTERIMCTSFLFTGDSEYCIILSKALLFDSIILFLNLFYYEVDWPFLVFHWTILLWVLICFIFWFWEYFLIGDLIVFFRCLWLDVLRIFFIDDSIEFFRSFLMDVMFFLIFLF